MHQQTLHRGQAARMHTLDTVYSNGKQTRQLLEGGGGGGGGGGWSSVVYYPFSAVCLLRSQSQSPQAFFFSGWSPGETLRQWNGSAQNNRSLHETAIKRHFIRVLQRLSRRPTADKIA